MSGHPDPLPVAYAARDVDLDRAPVAQRQPPLASPGGFLEPQIEHRLVVAAAHREALEARPSGWPARTAEDALEEVAEVAAAELDAHIAKPVSGVEPLTEAGGTRNVLSGPPVGAEAVVSLSLLGVAQHLVGLGDLLEAVLGAGLLVDVRVVAAGEPPVRLSDLVFAGVPGDLERLVVVLEGDRHQGTCSGARATTT